jgi:hypothetical protein
MCQVNINEQEITKIIKNAVDSSNLANTANNINNKTNIIINDNKTTARNVSVAINSSHNLIKYLMLYHKDVPPLEQLTNDKCKEILEQNYNIDSKTGKEHIKNIDNNCKLNDYILHRKILYDYITNDFLNIIKQIILKTIKKIDNNLQSIYNTDSNRLNYVIKSSINNWIEDKSGINFITLVIKPILTKILDLLYEYISISKKELKRYEDNSKITNNKINMINMKLDNLYKNIDDQINTDSDADLENKIYIDIDQYIDKLYITNNKINMYDDEDNEYSLYDKYNIIRINYRKDIELYTKTINYIYDTMYNIKQFINELMTNKYEKALIKELAPHLRMLTNTDLTKFVDLIDNNKYDEYINKISENVTNIDIHTMDNIIHKYRTYIHKIEVKKLKLINQIMN